MTAITAARADHARLHAAYRHHEIRCCRGPWNGCSTCDRLIRAADAAGERWRLAEDDARMAERRVAR